MKEDGGKVKMAKADGNREHMRAAPVKLTPLSLHEQQYAAENHHVLMWCMSVLQVPYEDYDIAALGYLQAVKKWYARPELHIRSFKTIARYSVMTYVGNARKAAGREVKAISLDDIIPGTDGWTYGSMVTYEHMDYLYKRRTEMEDRTVKYDVRIPEAARIGRQPCVEIELLADFLESDHKTMQMSYKTRKTASSKASSLRTWIKKNGKDVAVYKYGTEIYLEKTVKKKGMKQTC